MKEVKWMFFKIGDDLTPCKMFSIGHFLILSVTIFLIFLALHFTKNFTHNKVKRTIQISTITLVVLEVIKIVLTVNHYGFAEVNKYVPLYFCSLILYAGILSGFTKGKLKRVGDVFLATGGIVAGTVFLICPLTSLPNYPLVHFISLYSFLLHGTMIYIGLLIHKTNYITLEKNDIEYYASLILIISLIALSVNHYTGGNLMFIANNFPGTFIEIIYGITGPFFTIFMIAVQAILPFYVVYFLANKFRH